MFEYDNGNMKMYHNIDMNNHKIKNIAPPTDPTDLLTKESLITNDIYVSGSLVHESHSNHHFVYSYGKRTKLYNPYINFIIINASSNFYNTNDTLEILTLTHRTTPQTSPRLQHYRFPFHTSSTGYAKIIINSYFPCDLVDGFNSNRISNATFTISHRPVTFKPLPIK